MRNDTMGMIPSNANPYKRDTLHYFPEVVPPKPTLTLADLDEMVRQRIALERSVWAEETRREAERAWEEGRSYGQEDARGRAVADCASAVTQVIRGRLNHSVRHLRDRMDRPKTTIKAERVFCEQVANEISAAIMALSTIDAVEN